MKVSSIKPPSYVQRITGIWYRHFRVYTSHFLSNAVSPFFEPLIFLAGIGLGLGKHLGVMGGVSFIQFLGSGLIVMGAMYSAAFECTFGTYFRLEMEGVYDGILATPITATELVVGEIFWASTKAAFYSFSVLVIIIAFGIIPIGWSLAAPIVGFFTGLMFSSIALLVTSFTKSIQHFNIFITGFLSPMFFFSGAVFPVEDLPNFLQPVAWAFPLTHTVRLARALCFGKFEFNLLWNLLYIVVFTIVVGWLAIRSLKRRLID